MKKCILTLSLVTICLIASAQITVSVITTGTNTAPVSNNQTISVTCTLNTEVSTKFKISVANTNTYKTTKDYINLTNGSEDHFCLGTDCYPPSTHTVAKIFSSIAATDLMVYHTELVNNSTVTYKIENTTNINESLTIVLVYSVTPVGINENKLNTLATSEFYPNPSNGDEVKLDIQNNKKPVKVTIYNKMGQILDTQVLEYNGTSTTRTLNVSNLKNGLYYTHITSNNLKTTKTIIINK